MPSQPRWIRPSTSVRVITSRTTLEGMVKPWPRPMPTELMPITSPCRSTRGPPELPGSISASVWMKSLRSGTSVSIPGMKRPLPLTIPKETVRSKP